MKDIFIYDARIKASDYRMTRLIMLEYPKHRVKSVSNGKIHATKLKEGETKWIKL